MTSPMAAGAAMDTTLNGGLPASCGSIGGSRLISSGSGATRGGRLKLIVPAGPSRRARWKPGIRSSWLLRSTTMVVVPSTIGVPRATGSGEVMVAPAILVPTVAERLTTVTVSTALTCRAQWSLDRVGSSSRI